ncbi:MAG: hypothetical protein ACE5GQ_05965 [Nitrospinales bacterium]
MKNQLGKVLAVPDDWTEETLREKSLMPVPEKPKPSGTDMPLDKLKAMARKRGIPIGRLGKKRIIEKLAQAGALGK